METDTLKSDLLRRKAEYLQALQELEQDIQAIEAIEKKYSLNTSFLTPIMIKAAEPVQLPTPMVVKRVERFPYPADSPWNDKFEYIVGELGHATYEEVSERLVGHQPGIDPDKAKRLSQLYLSSLYKKGRLKARKKDGLYVYSL